MCGVPAAMLAISAGSAIMSYVGSNQQADTATASANANLQQQLDTNAVKQQQINAQATDKQLELGRQAQQAEGASRAASGEAGIGGINADRMANSIQMTKGFEASTIEANRKAGIAQTKLEDQSFITNAQSTINQANSHRQTLIGTGLQIAGAAATYGDQAGWYKPKAGA